MVKKISNNNDETTNKFKLDEGVNEDLEQRTFIGEDGEEYYGPFTAQEFKDWIGSLR